MAMRIDRPSTTPGNLELCVSDANIDSVSRSAISLPWRGSSPHLHEVDDLATDDHTSKLFTPDACTYTLILITRPRNSMSAGSRRSSSIALGGYAVLS
jgi:hypothetical protein